MAHRLLVRQGCPRTDTDAVLAPLDHAHRGVFEDNEEAVIIL